MSYQINVDSGVASLGASLRLSGALSATITYSGLNDDGCIDDSLVMWPNDGLYEDAPGIETLSDVEYTVEYRNLKGTNWTSSEKTNKADFATALTDICLLAIDAAGFNGWENSNGSSGSFTVYAEGYAKLSHNKNCIRTDTRDFNLNNSMKTWEAIQVFAKILREAGADEVYASYVGNKGKRKIDDFCIETDVDDYTKYKVLKAALKSAGFNAATWALLNELGLSDVDYENSRGSLTIAKDGTASVSHDNYISENPASKSVFFGENIPVPFTKNDYMYPY